MKKSVVVLVVILICLLSFIAGRSCTSWMVIPKSEQVVVDSTTTEATIQDSAPVVRDSVVVKYIYDKVPIGKTIDSQLTEKIAETDSNDLDGGTSSDILAIEAMGDTANVIIPISQKVYETQDYRAYVSGYKANLDSIFINHITSTVRIREPTKQKRFSIGLQAGYGMTPKGFQPYIGVGGSVTLWSF